MLVRLVQNAKAYSPMLVTLSGIVMFVRLVQLYEGPERPILVTLSGIVMLIRLVQPEKAPFPDAGDAVRDRCNWHLSCLQDK